MRHDPLPLLRFAQEDCTDVEVRLAVLVAGPDTARAVGVLVIPPDADFATPGGDEERPLHEMGLDRRAHLRRDVRAESDALERVPAHACFAPPKNRARFWSCALTG